jgi:hypothetical protein
MICIKHEDNKDDEKDKSIIKFGFKDEYYE